MHGRTTMTAATPVLDHPRNTRKYIPAAGDSAYLLCITALFIVSRIIFSMKGGEFISSPIDFAKQYLDPLLLKHDLMRSLYYLHAQPPLFNAFLGLVLKFSSQPALSFELVYKTAGICMPLLFYGILTSLAIRPAIAFIATVIFMCNPTLLLYENLLYYTHMEAFFILLALFALLRWGIERRSLFLLLFFLSLLCLGMIRSLFHTVFFLLTALLFSLYLGYWHRERRLARHFLLYSLIVLIPMISLSVKNSCLYKFFGTSSWDGMSLWIKANGYAPEQLDYFRQQGIISDMGVKAAYDPFQPLDNFFNDADLKQIPCHHPADCRILRSSGYPNFNHSGYVSLSKQLRKDAVALILHDPGLFAYYTAGSYCLMLWHASDSVNALFYNNATILDRIENAYRFLHFGFFGIESKQASHYLWWVRTTCISLLFLFFYISTLVAAFRKAERSQIPVLLLSLFCVLIHAYTLCVSSLIEFGENNRFRYPIDAALLVLIAATIARSKRSLFKISTSPAQ
jgi:hypothetical protein